MSDLIKQQFVQTRKTLKDTLSGVNEEVLTTIPNGFNNNIHWQVGHILTSAEMFMFFGQESLLPKNYGQLFGYGSKPTNWSDDVPSIDTLLEQLDQQLANIQNISAEYFQQQLPEAILGNQTTGELAAMGAFHEAMHLGQIQSLKRLIEAK